MHTPTCTDCGAVIVRFTGRRCTACTAALVTDDFDFNNFDPRA